VREGVNEISTANGARLEGGRRGDLALVRTMTEKGDAPRAWLYRQLTQGARFTCRFGQSYASWRDNDNTTTDGQLATSLFSLVNQGWDGTQSVLSDLLTSPVWTIRGHPDHVRERVLGRDLRPAYRVRSHHSIGAW
jgi:hypothetical protein